MTDMIGREDRKAADRKGVSDVPVSASILGVAMEDENECSRSFSGPPEPNVERTAMSENLKLFKIRHVSTLSWRSMPVNTTATTAPAC
jgi:hypothetical protein